MGNRCSAPREEYPVPNRSSTSRTPTACSASTTAAARSASSISEASVSSSSRAAGRRAALVQGLRDVRYEPVVAELAV